MELWLKIFKPKEGNLYIQVQEIQTVSFFFFFFSQRVSNKIKTKKPTTIIS